MLQVLASLSGRTHIQYPSDKSTPVWCEKNKKNKNNNIMLLGAEWCLQSLAALDTQSLWKEKSNPK